MNQLMKRVLSVLLVVCLLCSALPSAFAAEGGGFTDVSKDHWAYDAITEAVAAGYFKGVSDTAIRNYNKWADIRVNMDTLCEGGTPDTTLELFGKQFKYPFFAGPVGAVNLHYSETYTDMTYNDVLVRACAENGIAAFTGDGTNPTVMEMATKAIGAAGGCGVPTIKPWNIDTIREKMAQAKASGCFAVAMDVDAAGLPFLKNMTPPAGSKSVEELADAALPDGRLRFSARVDGVGWFTGLADEVLRTESGAGRRLVLRGRGMDALLEDCEFDAQTGTGITPAALATRVLQPVGLSAWSDAQSATGTLKTALGSTGSSIVQDYCASAGLLPPRMLADGRVCLTATRRSGGTALQGGTVRERSVQALAGIGVLHAAGTTYENPAGGRETRWRSALGWPAAAEFARSMRDRDAVRLTLPGTHALEPGTTAEYGGRTLTLTACALRGSAAGITTELTLAAI